MTEVKPGYDADNRQGRELDGVQRIGDVIQQMIEDGPLRHLAPAVRINGATNHTRADRRRYG